VSAEAQRLLEELGRTLEGLLLAGTTTASAATQRTLTAAFEAASQARFLRLGATLRLVLEELKRFDSAPERFSGARLAFFVDRAWLLAQATRRALEAGDPAALAKLNASPAQVRAESLMVATLGVQRRHVPGAFSAFEFRLRLTAPAVLADGRRLERGTPLIYALVFPASAEGTLPPEAMLSLPQKQCFRPTELLEGKAVTLTSALLGGAPLRLTLTPDSRVTTGAAVTDWHALAPRDPADWRARIAAYRPDPLELPIEFADELLLGDWQLAGDFAPCQLPGRERELEAPLSALGCRFALRIDAERVLAERLRTVDGRSLALYAGVHLEYGRQVLTPLALLGDAPEYPGLDPKKFNRTTLVRALHASR
jgi:hypothetical protein